MKNILIIILTIFSVALVSCGKKEPADNKPVSASKMDSTGTLRTVKDDAPPKDVTLAYDLKKNQHLSYKLTSISQQNQTMIMDTTVRNNVKQTVSYLVDIDVKDVDNDRVMELTANVKEINMDAQSGNQKVSYSSGKLQNPGDKGKYVEYEALLNNPFSFRMNPKGEILEVYRVDKIADKFLELRGIKDSVQGEQKRQFTMNLSEGALKPLVQQIFRILPNNKLAVDSSWDYRYPSRLAVFDVQNINKYKLTGFEKLNDERLAVISASLDMLSKGQNKVSDKGIDYDFKNPVAEGNGKIYFNLNKGCVQSSKTTSKVKMSMSMKMPKAPRGPKSATRNDYIEATNILELL